MSNSLDSTEAVLCGVCSCSAFVLHRSMVLHNNIKMCQKENNRFCDNFIQLSWTFFQTFSLLPWKLYQVVHTLFYTFPKVLALYFEKTDILPTWNSFPIFRKFFMDFSDFFRLFHILTKFHLSMINPSWSFFKIHFFPCWFSSMTRGEAVRLDESRLGKLTFNHLEHFFLLGQPCQDAQKCVGAQ